MENVSMAQSEYIPREHLDLPPKKKQKSKNKSRVNRQNDL